ncbi:MAG: hypothetical protein R6V49_10185 [Bacteroidales bacterium]
MKSLFTFFILSWSSLLLSAQPLTGIKTIPGDYANLQVAIDTLNAKGVGTGGVTFQVAAGQVFSLTANPNALQINVTGTAANPIIFEKSGAGNNPRLQITGGPSTTDAGVYINGGDYITFNGIDILAQGSTSANYLEYGVYLNGMATNGARHNTFKNMTIRMSQQYTGAYGIHASSTATSAAGSNSWNTIQNVTVKNAIRAIWFTGVVGFEDIANNLQGVTVDSIGVSGNTAYGIHMNYQDSIQVTQCLLSHIIGNSIYGVYVNNSKNFTLIGDTVRNVANGTTGTVYSIYFPASAGNNLIKGNVVHSHTSAGGGINPIFRQIGSSTNHITENLIYNIHGSFTGGQIFGIIARDGTATDYIYRNTVHNLTSAGNLGAIGTLYTSAATNTEHIFNNMVYDLKGPTTASTYMVAGYYFIGGAVKFYYNTAYMNYTSTSSTNTSAALYVNPANGTTLDARNNMLVNMTNVTTGLRATAFWWNGTTYTNLASTCNNNLLYAGTPGTKNLIFYNGTTGYQTLTTFKTAVAPRETNSVTEMPPFINAVAPYNVHINPGILTQAESGGQPITIPLITNDIDNDVRWGHPGYIGNGTAPDIGADEFSVLNTDCGISAVIAPADTFCSGSQPVTIVLKNYGPFPLTTAKINWTVNSMVLPQYTWNGQMAVNSSDTIAIGSYTFHHDTAYVITAWTSQPNYGIDPVSWNDTITKSNMLIKAPPALNLTSSVFHICQGDTGHITGTLTGTAPWTLVISDGATSQTLTNITSNAFAMTIFTTTNKTFTIQSITDGGACPNTTPSTFQVLVNPAPPATINPSGAAACCSGDSVTLMGTIGLNFSYQWLKDGVNIPNATNYVYFAKTGGAYTVKVTSPVGCSAVSAPVAVTVHPAPAVFLGNDTVVAAGATVTLNAGAGFTSYLWSTGGNTQIINVDSSGTGLGTKTVWARVTDNMGCKGADTIRISFVINPGLTNNSESEQRITLFPNPTSGVITLNYVGTIPSDLRIDIYSTDGRLIRSILPAPVISGTLTLNLKDLSPSLYRIVVHSDSGNLLNTWIVIK